MSGILTILDLIFQSFAFELFVLLLKGRWATILQSTIYFLQRPHKNLTFMGAL